MIRFEGVHKWFGKLHVLNNINLQVRAGEVVVVCGPSGSGKSTLIRTINDLEPINEGKLFVDGIDLSTNPGAYKPVHLCTRATSSSSCSICSDPVSRP